MSNFSFFYQPFLNSDVYTSSSDDDEEDRQGVNKTCTSPAGLKRKIGMEILLSFYYLIMKVVRVRKT